MSSRSPRHLLSTVALVVLALVAAGLSVAALAQNRNAIPAPATTPSVVRTMSPTPSPGAPKTAEAPTSVTPSEPADTPPSTTGDSLAVILGDQQSAADVDGVWVDTVAGELGWATVVNLSSPGRGYLSKPSSCDLPVCANFGGTIAAVVAEKPDVVVTFGGWEDGDYDLSEATTKYFTALREALPDAQLVAISPVTSQDQPEYFLQLHGKTIRAAVEAVGGTYIDVGQPGVGDGDELSAAAQNVVAETVIAKLS